MPKVLNLQKSKLLLGTLFPNNKPRLEERDGLKIVFFEGQTLAHFYGPTWEDVMRKAHKELYKPNESHQTSEATKPNSESREPVSPATESQRSSV